MAEDDIYGNKRKYNSFKTNLTKLLQKPGPAPAGAHPHRKGLRKYYCRNPDNLRHFRQLMCEMEARDLSYIRRLRVLQTMRFITHHTEKDLSACDRDDINSIMTNMHEVNLSPESKKSFVKILKYIWRALFPEPDSHGRVDSTICPYPVRHLRSRVDRSKKKSRRDRLTSDEFARILTYFSRDPRIQAYLAVALESLARPQELLYVRVRNVELHDCYARIRLTEHGKEGPGLLPPCIDSFPYLLKWLDTHPCRNDPDAFLFVNIGNTNTLQQLKPAAINKMLRHACGALRIGKPVTCYSLKRNGVTFRRLRGDSDVEIQHAARWTTTQQLKTYDQSNQEDAFRMTLSKRGLVPAETGENHLAAKKCRFCGATAGFEALLCPNCKRALDREKIVQKEKAMEEAEDLRAELARMKDTVKNLRQEVLQQLAEQLCEQDDRRNAPKVRIPEEV